MANALGRTAALAFSLGALAACGSFEAAPDSPPQTPVDAGATNDAGGTGDASRYRRPLSIKNPGTTPLPAGHVVCASLSGRGGATIVENKSAREDLGDVRLFGPDGEIPRVADLRGAIVVVCGRTVRPIAAGATDDAYSVHYGDPNASPPSSDPSTVFDVLYDSFEDATLRAHWKPDGDVKPVAGALVLAAGTSNSMQSSAPGLDGDVSFEARVRITNPAGSLLGASYRWWFGFQDLGAENPWTIFISRNASTIQAEHSGLSECSGTCASAPQTLDAAYHVYRIDRTASTPSGARFEIDAKPVHSVEGTTKPMSILFQSFLKEGDVLVDWVRARPLAKPEPEVTVGEEAQR